MSRAVRIVFAALLVGYVAVMVFIVITPSGDTPSNGLTRLIVELGELGVPPEWRTVSRIDFLANVALLVPPVAAAAMLLPRPTWRDWTAYGFVASAAVEATQALFLSERAASFSDVVANTTGALVGALLVHSIRWTLSRARPTPRTDGPRSGRSVGVD
jgi:glycopeptide antibiotics resistance protein